MNFERQKIVHHFREIRNFHSFYKNSQLDRKILEQICIPEKQRQCFFMGQVVVVCAVLSSFKSSNSFLHFYNQEDKNNLIKYIVKLPNLEQDRLFGHRRRVLNILKDSSQLFSQPSRIKVYFKFSLEIRRAFQIKDFKEKYSYVLWAHLYQCILQIPRTQKAFVVEQRFRIQK